MADIMPFDKMETQLKLSDAAFSATHDKVTWTSLLERAATWFGFRDGYLAGWTAGLAHARLEGHLCQYCFNRGTVSEGYEGEPPLKMKWYCRDHDNHGQPNG